jgi:TolB-like protein
MLTHHVNNEEKEIKIMNFQKVTASQTVKSNKGLSIRIISKLHKPKKIRTIGRASSNN